MVRFARPAGWPAALVALVGVTLAVGLPVGGYYAYRAYDFVEHDNNFCMSCHLMEAPFEAFARSEHRGLGCKACHQPSLAGRSQMALTQVIEQPEELTEHAEVPDEICTNCHVEGDPDKWRLIAQSAGHRIHLESTDSTLADVTCVGCHSRSIHEFAATDQTCAQSACHTDTEITLGDMGDFTIHCVACHAFRAPLPADAEAEEVRGALRPDANECLSCHVMRTLVDLPPDEPHQGVCASCHNPHEQATASESRQTCANVGCHEAVEGETPFHVGLDREVLNDCVSCHGAHDFVVDGNNCQACHTEIPNGTISPQAHAVPPAGRHLPSARLRPIRFLGAGLLQVQSPPDEGRPFNHDTHTSVDCLSCHATDGSHGRVTVTTPASCQSCHHVPEQAGDCAQCHTESDGGIPTIVASVPRTLAMSVGDVVTRDLPFDHDTHASEACVTCHEGAPPQLSAAAVDCVGCHSEHHAPDQPCVSCHTPAPVAEHPVEQVHAGCSGAACHDSEPWTPPAAGGLPKTRPFCLTCHQELADHRPEQNCADCHALPGGDS